MNVPCSQVHRFKILNILDIETILNILYTRATKANTKYFERRRSMWTNAYSYEDIGEFLREARRARGITQVEMARKLGFSSVTLSALETGKNVSAIKVDRYLQQLGFRMVIVPKGCRRGGDREAARRLFGRKRSTHRREPQGAGASSTSNQSSTNSLAGRCSQWRFPQKFARSARRKLLPGLMVCFPRETAATRFAGALACCRMTGSAFSPR